MDRVRPVRGAVGVVLAVGLALLLPGLGQAPFDDPGEGMHGEIAREILLTGDWATLHLNGVPYFDKPPLLYWLAAASMAAWGTTEWAARLWPLLGSLAAAAGTALLGVRLLSFRAGCVAGLALLSSPGFFAYARYLRPETLFVAAVQWGIALLLLAQREHRGLTLLGCAALALAALSKDPLGALGPLAAYALALALAGRLRPISGWLPGSGIALLFILGGAWYLLVEFLNPGFLWYTVVDNHLLNAVGARQFPDEDVPLASAEFLAVAGLGAFPWVLPAALAVADLLRRRAWREPDEVPWVTLAIWAVAVFAFFSLARFKLPHYGLPAYPALALLAARWWEDGRGGRAVVALHLAAFAAIAGGLGWVYRGDGQAFMGWVFGAADVYTRKELAAGAVAPFPPWEDLRSLVGATAVVFGAGSLGLLAALALGARALALSAVLFAVLAWMPLVGRAESLVASARSVRPFAVEIGHRADPSDLLVHEGPIENSGALEFYSGRRPAILDGQVSVLGFGSTFPGAHDAFWSRARLTTAWRGPGRVFLVTIRDPGRSAVSSLPSSEVHRLAARGGRWLYSNRP